MVSRNIVLDSGAIKECHVVVEYDGNEPSEDGARNRAGQLSRSGCSLFCDAQIKSRFLALC